MVYVIPALRSFLNTPTTKMINKPDFGDYHLKNFGKVPTTIIFSSASSYLIRNGRTFCISFSAGTHIGTIEMPGLSRQQAESVYRQGLTDGISLKVN